MRGLKRIVIVSEKRNFPNIIHSAAAKRAPMEQQAD